jgi:hypothetical protein
MKHHTKLTPQEQAQLQAAEHQNQQETPREFATAEEMLRHDALHTPVPPAIAHRLQTSIAKLPPPARSWWQRWLKP